MKVKVAQSCMSKSLRPHGILQARILEWVAVPFSRGSSQPRDWTQVSSTAGGFLTTWVSHKGSPVCVEGPDKQRKINVHFLTSHRVKPRAFFPGPASYHSSCLLWFLACNDQQPKAGWPGGPLLLPGVNQVQLDFWGCIATGSQTLTIPNKRLKLQNNLPVTAATVLHVLRGLLLLNSGPASRCSKIKNIERQVFVARKVAFDQKAGNMGRRWTHVPQNQLWRFCSAMTVAKEKQGCTHR